MILQSLYEFALNKDLLSLEKQAFKSRSIDFVIDLDLKGNVIGVIDSTKNPNTTNQKIKTKTQFPCPRPIQNKNAGGVADFLVDRSVAVFGKDFSGKALSSGKNEEREENNRKKHENFWNQISEAHKVTGSPKLKALIAFQEKLDGLPNFVRHGKRIKNDGSYDTSAKDSWWIVLTDKSEKKLTEVESFTFAVNQQKLIEDAHTIKPYWISIFTKAVDAKQNKATRGLCSITGQTDMPLANLHRPKIENVPNTQGSGALLCSFDKPAFSSFEFKKNLNAASSITASTAYAKALNSMLKRDSLHSIALVKSVCCFWSKDPKELESFSLKNILEKADPSQIKDFFQKTKAGRESSLSDHNRFYALVLAGNAGRIMVRHWIDIPLKQAHAHIHMWFEDLRLEPFLVSSTKNSDRNSPYSLYSLARATVRDAKELRTEVVNELFLAALQGKVPSLMLLQPLMERLKINIAQEGDKALWNHSLFALTKLILNRHQRIYNKNKEQHMEMKIDLDLSSTDPAYLCGRLLAVLSRAQDKAHNYSLKGAGVAERYFGTAMTSPQSVFPLLLKLNRHHLNKIDKTDPKGLADDYLEKDMAEIMSHVNEFPRILNLKGQGCFALGYYHELAATQKKIQKYREQQKLQKSA